MRGRGTRSSRPGSRSGTGRWRSRAANRRHRTQRPWPRRSGTRCRSGRSPGGCSWPPAGTTPPRSRRCTGTGLERRARSDCCRADGVDLPGPKDAVVSVRSEWREDSDSSLDHGNRGQDRRTHQTRNEIHPPRRFSRSLMRRRPQKARAYRETPNTRSNPCRLVWRPSLRRRPTRPKHSLGTPTRCLGRLLVGAKPADRALLLLGAGLQLGSDREARLVALLKGVRSNDRESGSLFHRLQVSHPAELRKPFAEQPYSSGRTSEHRRFRPNLGGRPDLSQRTGLAEGLSVGSLLRQAGDEG